MDTEGVQNIHALLQRLEAQSGRRCMLKYMQGRTVVQVDAPQFFADIRRRSRVFAGLGLAGRHVGLMGKNSYDWVVSFCAVLNIGAVAVLLSREYGPQEVEDAAVRTDLDAVLFDREAGTAVLQAKLPEGVLRLGLEAGPDAAPGPEAPVCSRAGREDLACILFTSGTTEKSKAVMLSNRALIASFTNRILDRDFTALLAVLPFHHLAGIGPAINALFLGAVLCIGEEMKYLYRCLEGMQPDYLMAVPALMTLLADRLEKADAAGTLPGWSLRLISCGGAKFEPQVLQTFSRHGITILQGYGASEAGTLGFSWEMTPEHPDTIGKPAAGLEAKIVDGELLLRSDSLMMGYYKDEAATQEALKDGWYRTGDLCRRDAEGYFYLLGRRKNLIVLANGENVSPEEIESRLGRCPDVCEVMIGVEDGLIAGTVFPQYPPDGTETEKEAVRQRVRSAVQQFNDSVPTYKQVQLLHFQEQPFARTAVGKLIRRSVTGGIQE